MKGGATLELFSNKMRGIFIGPRVVRVFFSMVVIKWVRGIGFKLKRILAFGAEKFGDFTILTPSWERLRLLQDRLLFFGRLPVAI